MVISNGFLSRTFLSQAIIVSLVLSSFALNAMSVVGAQAQAEDAKVGEQESLAGNVPAGPYCQKLISTLEEYGRVAQVACELAKNTGRPSLVADTASAVEIAEKDLRDIQELSSRQTFFTPQEVNKIRVFTQQAQAKINESVKLGLRLASQQDRPDLSKKLLGQPVTFYDRLPKFSSEGFVVAMGVTAVTIAIVSALSTFKPV